MNKPAMNNVAGSPVLAVKNLEAWYGESHILHGMNFEVRPGEVVTLLGRNGAGKTSTLKSIMGIIGKRTGSVALMSMRTRPRRDAPRGCRWAWRPLVLATA